MIELSRGRMIEYAGKHKLGSASEQSFEMYVLGGRHGNPVRYGEYAGIISVIVQQHIQIHPAVKIKQQGQDIASCGSINLILGREAAQW